LSWYTNLKTGILKMRLRWVLVAHAYNPSYLAGCDSKDLSSRPALKDPIYKITRAKWTGGVAQEAQYLFYLSSNPSPIKKKVK
jgi:hypothetical protein